MTTAFTAPRNTRYTPEILAAAVAASTNTREVLNQLAVPRTGGVTRTSRAASRHYGPTPRTSPDTALTLHQ